LKTSTKFLALGAACAACCALPFVVPLLAGSAVLEFFGPAEASYVAVLATAAALAAFVFMRGKPSASCAASDASCGCADNPKLLKLVAPQEAAPIACTLTPGDFTARVGRIRDLAARSLRTARREPLRLHLSYAPEAAQEVRGLVREEQGCCAFLQFDVQDDACGLHVTITAPEEARDAADALFAHFAPEWAHDSTSVSPKPKEPAPS
jgi:hypothetical protein